MAGLNLWHCKQGFKPTQLICPKMPTDCSGLSQNYIEDLRGCIHKCYPFDLCSSKCRFSNDRIKQRSHV